MGATLTVGSPGAGQVAAVSMSLWRSEDAGGTWVLVSEDVVPNSTVVDYVPPLNSTVTYRAEAVSATPSSAMSADTTVFTSSAVYNRIFLNAGPSFSAKCFLSPNAKVSPSADQATTLQHFSGREKPVEFSAIQTDDVIGVSGTIVRDSPEDIVATSTYRDFHDMLRIYKAPLCLRDLRGNKWFVSVSGVALDDTSARLATLSFTATEIDWTEVATVGIGA